MLSLALKNIRRNLVQSILTVLGIMLSVSIILAVSMMNSAIRSSVEKTIQELGTGKTGIWIEERGEDVASIGTKKEGFSQDIISKLLENESISSAHPLLKVYTTASGSDSSILKELYLYGINLENDNTVRNYVISKGTFPANDKEAIIGERIAKELKIDVGSDIVIQTPKGMLALKVVGTLPFDEGVGTLNNNMVIFADILKTQKFFMYENKVTSINLVLKQGVKPTSIVSQIKTHLTGNVNAFTDPIADASGSDSTSMLRVIAFIFAFISIFIAIFIIYNTLASSVEQSRREIGLLRLIGMTNKQIIKYFFFQSLIYSIVGSALGVGIGIGMGAVLLSLMNMMLKYSSFFFQMPSVELLIVALAIGIVLTVVVGIFPAIKASKTSPLSVFKNYESSEGIAGSFSLKNVIGIILILGGVVVSYLPIHNRGFAYAAATAPMIVFIGFCMNLNIILPPVLSFFSMIFSRMFGISGQLAVQSLYLSLSRTITTIGAIVVAIGIFLGLLGTINSMKGTVGEWLENTNWADVILFSISGAEIDESIMNEIHSFEFVEKVNPMRYCFVPYGDADLSDEGLLFQGFEPDNFQAFTGMEVKEGNTLEKFKELQNSRSILINENLSNMIGFKTGDTIMLRTNKGLVDFKIIGTVSDYSDFVHRLGKIIYGSHENLAKYWDANGYTVIQIKIKEGLSQDNAKKQLLRGLSGKYNIKVITNEEEKKDVGGSIDTIMTIFYAVIIIIFIIVFMGIFNTMLINVLFQIREFAILRTVGCYTRQIRTIVISEALVMGIIGYIFAAILGLWFAGQLSGRSSDVYGIVLNYYMPLGISAILFVVTILVTTLATFYPLKKASGLSITKVLQEVS